MTDCYFRYIKIAKLSSTTTGDVLNRLKLICSCHRIYIFISENGPVAVHQNLESLILYILIHFCIM